MVICLAFLKTKEVISLSFYSFRWWGNYACKLLIITRCLVQFVPFPSDPLLSSPIKARTRITRPKEGETLAAERACRNYDLGCARNIILPRPRLQPQKSIVVNVTDFFFRVLRKQIHVWSCIKLLSELFFVPWWSHRIYLRRKQEIKVVVPSPSLSQITVQSSMSILPLYVRPFFFNIS